MKKKLLFLILFLLFIFAGYRFVKAIEGIETTDLDYNTVYSEKYEENFFNDKLLGKTKKQIIDKLGKPLRAETINPYLKFLYRDKKDSIYIDCSKGVDLSKFDLIKNKYSFLTFEFDTSENVKDIYKVENSEKVESDSLIGISKSAIIHKFGKPAQIVKISFEGNILSFSNLKQGAYTGKKPKIHMRNIIFDKNNKAVKIIKSDGYNVLDGLCEVLSF